MNLKSNTFYNLQSSREQLAIAEFARALLVIPKTLAVNAAQDATDLVAKLRAFHNSSQTKADHANLKWFVKIFFFLIKKYNIYQNSFIT